MTITASFDITMSDAALSHIKTMIDKQKAVAFRLSIKKTGCSGFAYVPTVVDSIPPSDTILMIDGVTILIDTTWQHLLSGIQVDYSEEESSKLKQKRLTFINPKEKARCGCGMSFQAE